MVTAGMGAMGAAALIRETAATTPTGLTGHTLTQTQAKFWAVLQDEENRTLSVSELCKKAGYRSNVSWRKALKDLAFREMVLSLGVIIHSREKPIEGIVPLADNPDEEWAKDRIDLRRLLVDYPKHLSGVDFKLDFSPISNPKLKALVKRYFRARLGFWGASTFSAYLWRIKPFLLGLSNRYPDMESFAPLTRQMVEPLLSNACWIDTRGGKHAISVHAKRHMVVVLEGMFTYMQRHEWGGAPTRPLIYDEDSPKLPKRRPRPIPESVLEQLRANLHLLGAYAQFGRQETHGQRSQRGYGHVHARGHARNLIEILLVTGLRAADALHLPEDCLEYDATGDPRLRWYNHKMKRDGRPLPVTKEVAEAVQRQRELIKDVPDLFGKQ